jgi:hypothetical protein
LTLANFPVRNVKKQENNNGELRRNIIDKKCRWVIELFFVDLFTTPVFIASHLGILGNPSTIVVAWIEAFSNKSNYRSTWQQTWQGGEHSFGNETHGQRVQIVWIIFLVDSKFFLLLVFFELIKIVKLLHLSFQMIYTQSYYNRQKLWNASLALKQNFQFRFQKISWW